MGIFCILSRYWVLYRGAASSITRNISLRINLDVGLVVKKLYIFNLSTNYFKKKSEIKSIPKHLKDYGM